MMNVDLFIQNYKEAFGEIVELPIVFGYSNSPLVETEKINGCFLKGLRLVREGFPISVNLNNIGCMGGKFYTGFVDMPEQIPQFVSLKEKYKKTPDMVIGFINNLNVYRTKFSYLNFTRIDQIDTFEGWEGIFFLANPDMLSGLASWAYFDNNSDETVTSIFGSGCSSIITQAVNENRKNGRRTFIGLLDPSARPYFEEDILSFMIPMSRFKEMCDTMRQSCLFDTHAWGKVRSRINK